MGFSLCFAAKTNRIAGSRFVLAILFFGLPSAVFAQEPPTGSGTVEVIGSAAGSCRARNGTPHFNSVGAYSGCTWPSGAFTPGSGSQPLGGEMPNDGGSTVPNIGATTANDDGCGHGNPIYPSSGNKMEPETDFAADGEVGLYLGRTYNHYWKGVGLFGKNWVSSLDYKLVNGQLLLGNSCAGTSAECTIGSNATIQAWRPDGRTIIFRRNLTDGIYYESKAEPIAKIVIQGDGSAILYGEDKSVETYNSSGAITKITNEQGVGWTYTYTGAVPTKVTHTSGRYIQLTWTGTQLTAVRDPAGSTYSYTYTADRLDSVTKPGTPATTVSYHYELPSDAYALTGKSFNGVRYSTFAYDTNGYAISTEHGGFDKYTFVYTQGTDGVLTVVETNPLGKKSTLTYNGGKPLTATGQISTYCPATYAETTYDANGYPQLTSDFNGNATTYVHNPKGQLTEQVDGYGASVARKTTWVWDAVRDRVISVTVGGVAAGSELLRTTYTYTADNRLSTVTQKNLSSAVPVSQNQQRVTTYTYTEHPSGMLKTITVDGPLSGSDDAVTQTYDTYGNLLSTQNSLSQAVTYSLYNALGQPGRITGINGAITEYSYDPQGRVVAEKHWINGAWQVTNYFYDALDHVTGVRTPDGHWQVRQYDVGGRMTTVYEPEVGGTYAQTRYTYNNMSLPTRIDTERVSGVTLAAPLTAAPTLTAPATSATGSYTVSWTTVTGATAYVLEESVGAGAWNQIQNAAGTSKALSGKGNGIYNYRVTACNSAGCGPVSVVDSTVVSVPAPAAPTLTGPATYLTTRSYTVTWSSVATATSYQLEEKVGGVWTQVYNGTGTSMAFTGKADGNYSYQVKACNAYGCGAYSTIRTITVEWDPCPSCFMAPEPDPEASITTDDDGDAA